MIQALSKDHLNKYLPNKKEMLNRIFNNVTILSQKDKSFSPFVNQRNSIGYLLTQRNNNNFSRDEIPSLKPKLKSQKFFKLNDVVKYLRPEKSQTKLIKPIKTPITPFYKIQCYQKLVHKRIPVYSISKKNRFPQLKKTEPLLQNSQIKIRKKSQQNNQISFEKPLLKKIITNSQSSKRELMLFKQVEDDVLQFDNKMRQLKLSLKQLKTRTMELSFQK